MNQIDEPALQNLLERLYEAAADWVHWPDFAGACGRAIDASAGGGRQPSSARC